MISSKEHAYVAEPPRKSTLVFVQETLLKQKSVVLHIIMNTKLSGSCYCNGILMSLLPPSSLLQSQKHGGGAGDVIETQGIGVFDEGVLWRGKNK